MSSSSSCMDSIEFPDSLSHQPFLSSIAPGRSSRLHSVSTWSSYIYIYIYIYVLASQSTLA